MFNYILQYMLLTYSTEKCAEEKYTRKYMLPKECSYFNPEITHLFIVLLNFILLINKITIK